MTPSHRIPLLLAASLAVGLSACSADTAEHADGPAAAAEAFLAAWAKGDTAAAAGHTSDPKAAAGQLRAVEGELRPRSRLFTARAPEEKPGTSTARVPFHARLTLAEGATWSYDSTAQMVRKDGAWKVAWRPSVVHPALTADTRLQRVRELPPRAQVLAEDGYPVAADAQVWSIAIWPAELTDPERAYRALDALKVDLDTRALRKRVATARPDQSVPVVTLREEVYQDHRARLLPIPGLQFRSSQRSVARMAKALVGTVAPASQETLRHAGPGAAAEDVVGASGLQYRYQRQLAGRAAVSVRLVDRLDGDSRTLFTGGGKKGTPLRTTLSARVQQAAEAALKGLDKNAALVALRPSTGHVLAVADNPADQADRALTGRYPPGSTFKAVTAAALLQRGLDPDQRVDCPRYARVDGQRFENQDLFRLPPHATFHDAFARSCNTAFVGLRDRLEAGSLTEAAARFGIGGTWSVGAATYDGSVPVAASGNEKAAGAIGQARIEVSPLVMASVAATVQQGRFHQPVLVPGAAGRRHEAPQQLAPDVAGQLRSLMRAVVTEGSGRALKGIPGAPAAKTGTAEFGTDSPPRTHAWMIGFNGDLAFAVLLEDGGSGGKDAGPVAAAFLERLAPKSG